MSDTLVLCYHAIATGWDDPVAVSEARFAAQIGLLARLGYRGVTFTEAVTAPPNGRRVAVTFDDAFYSVLDRALPILQRYRWPATVFVVTGYADDGAAAAWPVLDRWIGTPHQRDLRTLSWDELQRLRAEGWEVGSHTASHPHLTALQPDAIRAELAESRRACIAELGACPSLAYPYGEVDAAVVEIARQCGYVSAAALPVELHPVRALEWPRIGVYSVDYFARFAAKISPVRRRLHAAR